MVNMGLCVSANILSEDAICIEHVAAQGESLWIPGSTEVMGTQTTSKKIPSWACNNALAVSRLRWQKKM